MIEESYQPQAVEAAAQRYWNEQRSFEVAADPARETLMGRGTDCHISLTDPLCSRVHAIIRCEGGERWVIDDQGSRNGTMVNGQKSLSLTVPSVVSDTVYSRFRISSDPTLVGSPTGEALDGEVEDYALMSVGNQLWLHDTKGSKAGQARQGRGRGADARRPDAPGGIAPSRAFRWGSCPSIA